VVDELRIIYNWFYSINGVDILTNLGQTEGGYIQITDYINTSLFLVASQLLSHKAKIISTNVHCLIVLLINIMHTCL
jgi:hypothetical protein